MGVRLIKFDRYGNSNNYSYDHDDMINRDMMNQHPIYAITGLQEVLNILEDSINDINEFLSEHLVNDIEIRMKEAEKDIEDLYESIRTHIIQDIRDTYSIDMDYDKENQILKANVKIHSDKTRNNAIQIVADGLYVPSVYTKNTNTVSWQNNLSEELFDLQQMFDTSLRTSHHFTSWDDIFDQLDCNGWTYNNTTKTIMQSQNTGSMAGLITQEFYDYYTHTVFISSTNADDDALGIIIGYILDDDLKPHTLSIVFDRQTTDDSYSLWYDYSLPDQERLFTRGNGNTGTKPNGKQTGAWSTSGGILVEIYKEHEILEITASNWGSQTLNQDTKISIDLFDYSWGKQFIDLVRYGYFSYSQPAAFFKVTKFEARTNPTYNTFIANVNKSKKEHNAIVIYEDGLWIPEFLISKENGNALEKKDDGYYVKAAISKEIDNSLEERDDGLYVRDYRNMRIVNQAAHNLKVGNFIYYHPVDKYQKALGIDDYDINIVGMVTKIIDKDNFEYQWGGFFATSLFDKAHGFVQGMPIYISSEEAGKTTQQQPDISKAVGYPVENLGIILSIERGIQYNQEASMGDFKVSANTYNIRSDGFIRIVTGVNYKQSLVQRLLAVLDDEFKNTYMSFNESNDTFVFINTETLYVNNDVPDGMNLFIKAF